jgi:hypothetical protein
MLMTKIFLITAMVFSFLVNSLAEAAAPNSAYDIAIEVSGDVPGFTHEQLVTYLAGKMHEEVAAPWHFTAGKPQEKQVPNRVTWSFKNLREVWKGGSHNGFPSPTNSETYLRAEVKLYVKDVYQMTVDTHPSVSGGTEDKALSKMVHEAAHALFIENKPDMP